MKKFFRNFYLLLIFLFLYAPIAVLMLYSFNDSKSRRIWHGFTTKWYVELLGDADILHSLYVTLLVGDLIDLQFMGGAYNPHLCSAIALVMIILIFICMWIMNKFDDGSSEEGGLLL